MILAVSAKKGRPRSGPEGGEQGKLVEWIETYLQGFPNLPQIVSSSLISGQLNGGKKHTRRKRFPNKPVC